jgi:hypothetical protein
MSPTLLPSEFTAPLVSADVSSHLYFVVADAQNSREAPFLVAKVVWPAMPRKGQESFFISNNSSSLRGRKHNDRTVALLPQES